jgi:hypothetical protein
MVGREVDDRCIEETVLNALIAGFNDLMPTAWCTILTRHPKSLRGKWAHNRVVYETREQAVHAAHGRRPRFLLSELSNQFVAGHEFPAQARGENAPVADKRSGRRS